MDNNIKDMLLNGESADDLIKDFTAQVRRVQEEIEQEKRANEKELIVARKTLCLTIAEYMRVLSHGQIDASNDDLKELEALLTEFEGGMSKIIELSKTIDPDMSNEDFINMMKESWFGGNK